MDHTVPKPALYALRGVSRQCPENTLAAVRTAICQGYDGVVLDVQVTSDGVPVLGRKIDVSDMTFRQVSSIDVGETFAYRFRGETIPKLSDALELAKAAGLQACLKMDLVPKDRERDVFLLAQNCMLCFRDAQRVLCTAEAVPQAQVGYWMEGHDMALQSLLRLGNRLTVFTDDPERVDCHRVCVTGVDSYDRFDEITAKNTPAAVCTSGVVKPDIRRGFRADMHIHSEYSPDSTCPIAEIGAAVREKNFDLVCVTDHCDIRPGHDEQSLLEFRKQTVAGIRESAAAFDDIQILAGVEMGGGFFEPGIADRMVAAEDYDVVIGSVHGIMFRGNRQSTALFDFGSVDEETLLEYLDEYLRCTLYMVEKLDVDVLAHLTYILRHINGKYKRDLDWRVREETIRGIFRAIIARGIPLEINTSGRGGTYDEWLPAREIVDMYLEMGGYLFTLGSDAHVSKRIGGYFDEVKDYLRNKGIRYLIYFKGRTAHQYSI